MDMYRSLAGQHSANDGTDRHACSYIAAICCLGLLSADEQQAGNQAGDDGDARKHVETPVKPDIRLQLSTFPIASRCIEQCKTCVNVASPVGCDGTDLLSGVLSRLQKVWCVLRLRLCV